MGVSRVVALWLALAEPSARSYAGPVAVPAQESAADVDLDARPVVDVELLATEDDIAPIERRVAELRRVEAPRSADCPAEPTVPRRAYTWTSGLLIVVGLSELIALGFALDCNGCHDPGGFGFAAASAVGMVIAAPVVGHLTFSRRYVALHRRIVHRGERVRPPRRGMMAPGVLLAIAGIATMATGALWISDATGTAIRLGGAGASIGGSIWAGRVRARRLAVRDGKR